ncbi:hypothetical protein FIBSPDRAFT_1036270 [Athelia psychrophila]|uniref:Carbonic anhydrase n=1 Tax=Athelia psychrophila TaxID=1759441 RepID=A0A166VWP0_9AGAM|nr:hypothetical protein FIBSPDRAFT_1036270 [Fibularhizoctonia sp. CBS 109695]
MNGGRGERAERVHAIPYVVLFPYAAYPPEPPPALLVVSTDAVRDVSLRMSLFANNAWHMVQPAGGCQYECWWRWYMEGGSESAVVEADEDDGEGGGPEAEESGLVRTVVLWIGCAGSRVPESLVTACWPGDIVVHRNIANQFHLDDDSVQSVLSYAITALGVQHGSPPPLSATRTAEAPLCACLLPAPPAPPRPPTPCSPADILLTRWLASLTSIASSILEKTPNAPLDALVEENVRAQVANLTKAPAVQDVWEGGKTMLWIHGLVYKTENGPLADLGVSMGPDVDPKAEKEKN